MANRQNLQRNPSIALLLSRAGGT